MDIESSSGGWRALNDNTPWKAGWRHTPTRSDDCEQQFQDRAEASHFLHVELNWLAIDVAEFKDQDEALDAVRLLSIYSTTICEWATTVGGAEYYLERVIKLEEAEAGIPG